MTQQMDVRIVRPWWRRHVKSIISLALVVLVALLTATALLNSATRTTRVSKSSVIISTVRNDVFRDATTLQGRIVPRDTVYLDALEGGQVERILVQAGDRVTEGQALIQFRNTQLELDVLDRVGRLIESITQLQAYEKQLEQDHAENRKAIAQIDYDIVRLKRMQERRGRLAAAGYAPREQLDQIGDELAYNMNIRPVQRETNRNQSELRAAQLPKIHAEEESLQRSLTITRAKLDDLVVRAPAAGRLTAMDLKIGQNRNRGDRLGEITLDTGFKITASVDEFYLARVASGQRGVIDLDGQPYPVRLTRVYPQVKNGTFTVDLEFVRRPPSEALIPGQSAIGRLFLGADRKALVLPAGAFLEASGGSWVFVLNRDGKSAERRSIRAGRRTTEQVEILSGLQPGDRVITSDYGAFSQTQRLRLLE